MPCHEHAPTDGADRSRARLVRRSRVAERCPRGNARQHGGTRHGYVDRRATVAGEAVATPPGRPVDSAIHDCTEPQPPPPPRLPQALDGGDDLRLRQRDHPARPAADRRHHAERHAVRVRPAHDDRVPAVHPVQPAGRRVGGPPPPPPDPHRGRPRPGAGHRVDPGGVLLRCPDDLAAVHRRLHQRHPDGVLRRRLPELPAERRRARPARRRQLEARDHAQRVADPRAGHGGHPDRLLPGAVRDDHRLGQLRRLGAVPDLDPAPGATGRGARRGGPRARSRRCARRSPSACATSPGTDGCGTSPRPPARRTSSAT